MRSLTPANDAQTTIPLAMPQQMGSLTPCVTCLPPQMLAKHGRSLRSGHGHGHHLRRTSPERSGRVTRLDAASKSCLLRDAAITFCKNNLLVDQDAQAVRESNQLETVRRVDKFFEVEMTVRDDDLDEYGVVNNAIYSSYIHRGRDILLDKLGINVSYWAATGRAMALTELNLKFFTPLRSGDRFIVKVKPVQIKGVRMIIHHMIETLPDRKLVLEAEGTVVFLNKDYRPARVFPEVSVKARAMFPCMEG